MYWDESRQRWVVAASAGFAANGKRIRRKASGKTKTEARAKLRQLLADVTDGVTSSGGSTVADVVEDWLTYGLPTQSPETISNYATIVRTRIVPHLGQRLVLELSADDVDRWLRAESREVSTRTLRLAYSLLDRSINRAMARDKVRRNVVRLCAVPTGQPGRQSKSLTLTQADAVLIAAESSAMCGYVVVSLLTGARTEEVRALRWRDVDLDGDPEADPPILPSISVLRSVRASADTKTPKSRRRLALPRRCVDALRAHRARLHTEPRPDELVFPSATGTPLDAHNVRRAFRRVVAAAGLHAPDWTPRELRHSFVSLLSDSGVPVEKIARLVGHRGGSSVTERIYRHQLRPVLEDGAEHMDVLFPLAPDETA